MNYPNAIQVFLFIAFFIGSLISITLIISKRHRSLSNYFLAFFLAVYAFKLLLNSEFALRIGFGNYLVVILLLTPSLYLYVYTLTNTCKTFKAVFLWHYLPGFLAMPLLFVYRKYWGVYNNTDVFMVEDALIVFSIIQALVVIHVIIYMLLVIRNLKEYKNQLEDNFSNIENINLRWLTILCYALIIVTLIWIIGGYGDIGYFVKKWGEPQIVVAYIFWVFMSSIVLLIGYNGFTKPEIFLNDKLDLPPKSIPKKKYSAKQLLKISEQLTQLMHDEKPFLNPTLKLGQLAEILGTNPSLLSSVINTVFEKNFNDFVNEYRVKEVINKIRNPEHNNLTLLGLAFDSGFNSKSSFNSVFKKVTGKTPNAFKRAL